MHVEHLMTRNVVTIPPDATVEEAAKAMADRNVGSLVVVEGDRLAGFLVDRQVVTHVVGAGKDASRVKVKEIMTKEVRTIRKDQTVFEACRVLGEGGFRRAPVVDGEKVVGILSVSDLAVAAECLTSAILEELRASQRNARVEHAPAIAEIEAGIPGRGAKARR